MNPKIKNELNVKNGMIVAGTAACIFFWKEILITGAIATGGWLLWKNKDKIRGIIQNNKNP